MNLFSVIKPLVIAAIVIGFMNCEQVAKIDAQMDADSTDIANEVSDLKGMGMVEKLSKEGNSELLFKASGSEPGWIAEYYTDKFRFVFDYGKDSLIIINTSKYFDSSKGYSSFSYIKNEDSKEIHLNVKIEDHECTNEAGVKNPKTITITLNDKIYTGCGNSVK